MDNMALKILIFVAPMALQGCAKPSQGDGIASDKCTPEACTIVVTVARTCSAASDITLTPDAMPVPRANHQLKMHWDLQNGPGQNFTIAKEPDGITFTTPPLPPTQPPPGEFHHPNLTAHGTKYNLTNENTTTETYKYNIQLLRADGTRCALKDPFIKNGA